VAKQFVCVRLVQIAGVDLNLFDFDYDLTWAAFFLNAEGKVYGRFGGREAADADSRNSLAGLHYALQAALDEHRKDPVGRPATVSDRPQRVESYPAAQKYRGCIHCHQVYEFQRAQLKDLGKWNREQRWGYPLPENIGITLEVDRGNIVRKVRAESPAAKVGLQPGDQLLRISGVPVASFADAQYGLHKSPAAGKVALAWKRGPQLLQQDLDLPAGWKKTNTTWRTSLLELLPSLPLYGEELTAAEKQKLGLAPRRLAFRQDRVVPRSAEQAGLRQDDVVIGVDNLHLEMGLEEFLGYIRRNYLVGDRITLNVLRAGKRLDLPLTLR
jgi:predicted metalloprotease with PDZ domain